MHVTNITLNVKVGAIQEESGELVVVDLFEG